MDEMLNDLKVLGKREISSVMKWRSKILHKEHVEQQKSGKGKKIEHESEHIDEIDEEEIEELD